MQGTMVFLVLRVRSPVSNEIRRYTVRQYLIAPSGGITCRLDNNAGRYGENLSSKKGNFIAREIVQLPCADSAKISNERRETLLRVTLASSDRERENGR